MSATVDRMPRELALPLAWDLVQKLGPSCERIEILGSLRRGRETAGDIEILCQPKTTDTAVSDMFGHITEVRKDSLLDHQMAQMLADGVLTKRQPVKWGDRYRAALFEGFPVDLFICTPPAQQWGYLSVLRTGPEEFSKKIVTPIEKGGWLPPFLMVHHGAIYRVVKNGVGELVETPEEQHVFAALGRRYVEPSERGR